MNKSKEILEKSESVLREANSNWDSKNDWFHEGNVSRALVEYLKSQSYECKKDNSDNIHIHGADIIVCKGNKKEVIEVKGYPSDKYALEGLRRIFLPGYQYKKAGVIITEITDNAQLGFFDSVDREKRERLMQVVDKINGKFQHHVKLAVQGSGRDWKLKQEQLSQCYTTDINEIIIVKCK